MKPNVFIGSSVENLNVAYALQAGLEFVAEPTVWDQGVFKPSRTTLQSLIEALDSYRFAIFAFAPDDLLQLRDHQHVAVRDNVLFELGLFIGRLGPSSVFIVMPRDVPDFRIPSDLLGVTPLTYDANRRDGNLRASLGPACSAIQAEILRVELPSYPESLRKRHAFLSERFRRSYVARLQRCEIPDGFPMPDNLEELSSERLEQIYLLLGYDDIIGNPMLRVDACHTRYAATGKPATKLDVYAFEKELSELEEAIAEWETSNPDKNLWTPLSSIGSANSAD